MASGEPAICRALSGVTVFLRWFAGRPVFGDNSSLLYFRLLPAEVLIPCKTHHTHSFHKTSKLDVCVGVNENTTIKCAYKFIPFSNKCQVLTLQPKSQQALIRSAASLLQSARERISFKRDQNPNNED